MHFIISKAFLGHRVTLGIGGSTELFSHQKGRYDHKDFLEPAAHHVRYCTNKAQRLQMDLPCIQFTFVLFYEMILLLDF